MSRLRKRVIPIFKILKKEAKDTIQHASLDSYKKSSTGRFKTCPVEEEN